MLYKNLAIFDGVSDSLVEGDIAVNSGLIAAESPSGEVMDCTGLYAIPGLIDAHVHMCLDPDERDPFAHTKIPEDEALAGMRVRAGQMLMAGITTARDLGGGRHLELKLRDEIARNETQGPRLLCAGQPITSPGGHCHFWGGEAATTAEALGVLVRQVASQVDLIKIMATGGNITPGSKPVDSQFDDATVKAVVESAHQHGLHVAAHCHGTDGIRQAAEAGVRTVEHCSWVGQDGWGTAFDEAIVGTMAEQGVYVSPTINAGWQRFRKEEFVQLVKGHYEKMKAAGVRLIASTDAGIPNVYHHDLPKALPQFARFASLSNYEVLKSATSECAEAIGLGNVTGRLAPGYAADFLILEGNPLEDLGVLEQPRLVVRDGVPYSPGTN